MVDIEEVFDEEPPQQQQATPANSRSQERLSDADELESALQHVTRPTARLHLESLITRLRKEAKALERVAASTGENPSNNDNARDMEVEPTAVKQAPTKPIPATLPLPTAGSKYHSFPTYLFDAGSYNSSTVTVYVPLDNIGSHDKSKITCNFSKSSFDLIVSSFSDGNDYRLLNDNLEHEINVSTSKYIVKPNKIIIKLGKIKGEYSYDHWSQLTAKKKKEVGKKEDPSAGIMDLMKDMYDSGDDKMKKMIGETMYKQRTGQLGKDGMGMGGAGGMGGMGMDDDFDI